MRMKIAGSFFCLFIGSSIISYSGMTDAFAQMSIKPSEKLKTSFVCMMNNKHFAVEQIPVEVSGKMYYGCCQGCVESLKNNRAIRYAIDPYSGEEVDKADAYIVLMPDGSQNVLYFKSEGNYMNFLKNGGKKNNS